MYYYIYDNVKFNDAGLCNLILDTGKKAISFDMSTGQVTADSSNDPSPNYGEHNFNNQYWRVEILPSTISGAKKVKVTQVSSPPSSMYLTFSVKKENISTGAKPEPKLQLTRLGDNKDVWTFAIGTDDVRVQRTATVGAAIFNLESGSDFYLRYTSGSYLLYYTVSS